MDNRDTWWYLVQRHGAALEVVTSRMRLIASQLETPLRIVGLCTSLANAKVQLPKDCACCLYCMASLKHFVSKHRPEKDRSGSHGGWLYNAGSG